MALEVGQVFAGYTISRVLGAGGMGAVYLASHPRLPREEALKVLPTELTIDPEFRGRFEREAEMVAGLSHPHIVGIHDRGETDGQFWISMDYVAGTDAARLLAEQYPGGMPANEAVPIITAVASALDYAHRRGLLHRDVKPANILLSDPDGQGRRVYLADFGIARPMEDAAGLTATNMTVGTVFYSAPEQLRGESIDGRADQYALACTAFHMLTGAPPYADSNPAVVITKHVSAPPPPIGARSPELAGLDSVFARAMAKERSGRFGSCREFADQLSQYVSPVSAYGGEVTAAEPVTVAETNARLGLTAPTVQPQAQPRRLARRPGVLVGALVAAVLLLAGGVFAVVTLTRHPHPVAAAGAPNSTPSAKAAAPNTGPLTGVYRVQFGPGANINDVPGSGLPPTTETYGIRSVCRPTGCAATASRLNGGTAFAPNPVFDQLADRWVAVNLVTTPCGAGGGSTAEGWEVFTLRPGPAGTFTGDYTMMTSNLCELKRTVTFTRASDVDVNTLPDPAALPPRVVPPAEALHGHYRERRTFNVPAQPHQVDFAVTTECLRTGERCMSFFYAASGEVEPLVFDGGNWVLDTSQDTACSRNGQTMNIKKTGKYPLPQPPQNPITLLTGHGRHVQSAPCAMSGDFDETFTRTGD
ncbi:serine/threonine-protein kinase [Mycobacterium sp.]|uniref:serine/threonine-protein kinase n=1 Tax=Mycobacterium sp. TaxID=1785 RepID=UPI002D1635D9|nr:serine/threonine-protein kinase [Mycobacterium sp.]HTQ16170.1 serine/threonine-protein kinase [Mycobacterium sp.]